MELVENYLGNSDDWKRQKYLTKGSVLHQLAIVCKTNVTNVLSTIQEESTLHALLLQNGKIHEYQLQEHLYQQAFEQYSNALTIMQQQQNQYSKYPSFSA